MPFKSKAQRAWMFANKPEMAKTWQEHTAKNARLPNKLPDKKAGYEDLPGASMFSNLPETVKSWEQYIPHDEDLPFKLAIVKKGYEAALAKLGLGIPPTTS